MKSLVHFFNTAFFFLLFVLGMAHAQPAAKVLPRVLVIGDFMYQEPVALMTKELAGKVQIVRTEVKQGDVLSSTSVLANFDDLLGAGKWDLILFNVGFGDLIHRVPGMKSFRVLPIHNGGIRNTSPQQYETNLHELVKRLKATDSKIVWANTTPIRASASNVFLLGSEVEYNAIAEKVMQENQVLILDMYSHVKSVIDMTKPGAHGVDPFFTDRKPIHEPIVKVIQSQLSLK